ncbi:NEQ216 [Nanoarchaeum equitans Kin4-M]|uniref:NEQ216 n=1 Tax=Nanoarchaeum equitans (strain Kin4-M) TaxID=228908 RepID=Q74MR0_NANEQ|nr:NEQ216 [Nanoarchaeum equitans Kin4-M]
MYKIIIDNSDLIEKEIVSLARKIYFKKIREALEKKEQILEEYLKKALEERERILKKAQIEKEIVKNRKESLEFLKRREKLILEKWKHANL